MNRSSSLLVVLIVIACARPVPAETQIEAIRQGAINCGAAYQRGDYTTLAMLTYAKLVDFFGGREGMIAAAKVAVNATEASGVKVISFKTDQPSQPISSNHKLFSVVPTLLMMSAPGVRIRQKSFLLAISTDGGTTWSFIDGWGLTAELRARIVPDLPSTLALPQNKQPIIERTN